MFMTCRASFFILVCMRDTSNERFFKQYQGACDKKRVLFWILRQIYD